MEHTRQAWLAVRGPKQRRGTSPLWTRGSPAGDGQSQCRDGCKRQETGKKWSPHISPWKGAGTERGSQRRRHPSFFTSFFKAVCKAGPTMNRIKWKQRWARSIYAEREEIPERIWKSCGNVTSRKELPATCQSSSSARWTMSPTTRSKNTSSPAGKCRTFTRSQ